jgi:hypothetical protein
MKNMKPISRIEALAGAFAKLHQAFNPESEAYLARNPGMLKAFSPKHEKNENGYRVFNSFSSGFDNLLLDLQIKCSGGSHARLKADDTLINLVLCYGEPATAATYIKKFLRKSLHDENILERTPLSFFVADQPKKEDTMPEIMTASVGE